MSASFLHRSLRGLGTCLILTGLLLVAAISTAGRSFAQEVEPWSNAVRAWHFKDVRDSSSRSTELKVASKGIDPGVELSDADRAASLRRGGDGAIAKFDGRGWLSSEKWPSSAMRQMTFCIRVLPAKSGGLFCSSAFSLVLHESGLAVAVVGVSDGGGRRYRELPLGPLRMGAWQDVVVRFDQKAVDFIVDGEFRNKLTFEGEIEPILPGPALLGAWRIHEPAVPGFAPSAVAWLFERVFAGSIDHVGLWERALTDREIGTLCGTVGLEPLPPMTPSQQCLADYVAFESASRVNDPALCERLGRSMRAFMAGDPRRPIYHLTAPMDGILDPAGAWFYKGQYHVFSYRNMVSLLACTPLAHYVSDDLIHWRDQPIAVWPDSNLDVQGIWLGNLFLDDDRQVRMLYTALGERGKIGVLARSRDDLISFADKEPVMTGMVHHDGHTWKDGDTWYSITTRQYWGRRSGDLGDALHLLTSPDLHHWTDRGEFFSVRKHASPGDDNQRWGFAEFPYVVPFEDKHAVIVGTRPVRYWIGRFDRDKPAFVPDEPEGKLLDHLNPFHCFNPSIVDAKGPGGAARRVILAMNGYPSGNREGIPWYGVHVLPRALTRDGNRLVQTPVPEIEALRGRQYRRDGTRIAAAASGFLSDVRGDALEIVAEFRPGSAKRFGLMVRTSGQPGAGTKIFYDADSGEFGAEGGLRKLAPYAELGRGPAYLSAGAPVRLHVFLDRSLLEVFVNGQTLNGVFSSPPEDVGLDLFSEGGDAELVSFDAWEMKSAWP